MRNHSKKPRYFVQSLPKGLLVLQAFTEAHHPLTLTEIANIIGTNKTVVTRFCYTLAELGFIQRDIHRRYQPTPKVLTLGYSFISASDWRKVAQYYLENLSEETQATTNLSVLEGNEILYAIRIRKRKVLPYDVQIGSKLPVYCTAMGKVLMALGPPEKTKPILKTLEFRPLTGRTITHLDKFLQELKKVRAKGYGINDEELSIGNRAVAAPVLDKNRYAVAAVNIAVSTTEYSLSQMERILAPEVIRKAQEISEALIKIEAPLVTGGQPMPL